MSTVLKSKQNNRNPTQAVRLCEFSLGTTHVLNILLFNLHQKPGIIRCCYSSLTDVNTETPKKIRSAGPVLTLPVEHYDLNSGLLTPEPSTLGVSVRKTPAT